MSQKTGLEFGAVLLFIFLVLKLTHYVDWSWWWVTSPLWLPITVLTGLGAVCLFFWVLFSLMRQVLIKLFDK